MSEENQQDSLKQSIREENTPLENDRSKSQPSKAFFQHYFLLSFGFIFFFTALLTQDYWRTEVNKLLIPFLGQISKGQGQAKIQVLSQNFDKLLKTHQELIAEHILLKRNIDSSLKAQKNISGVQLVSDARYQKNQQKIQKLNADFQLIKTKLEEIKQQNTIQLKNQKSNDSSLLEKNLSISDITLLREDLMRISRKLSKKQIQLQNNVDYLNNQFSLQLGYQNLAQAVTAAKPYVQQFEAFELLLLQEDRIKLKSILETLQKNADLGIVSLVQWETQVQQLLMAQSQPIALVPENVAQDNWFGKIIHELGGLVTIRDQGGKVALSGNRQSTELAELLENLHLKSNEPKAQIFINQLNERQQVIDGLKSLGNFLFEKNLFDARGR